MATKNKAVVAVYKSHSEAEDGIRELQHSGFDMKKLSIVGSHIHTEEHVVGYYHTGERMKLWGKEGAFWGGIWGWLFGSAFFFVPGIGPLVMAGPIIGWIIGALEGAVLVGGVSALGACLYSEGFAHDSVLQYEKALSTGKFIVIARGTAEEVALAREIINRTLPETLDDHQLSPSSAEACVAGG